MNTDTSEPMPDSNQDLDDPYIRIISTEEFVEKVEEEEASQQENDTLLTPSKDELLVS